MSEFDLVIWIGTAVLFCAFPLALWFTVDYGVVIPRRRLREQRGLPPEQCSYIPWWRNGIGIMWFSYGVTIMLLVGVVVVSRILSATVGPNWPGREWVTLTVYVVVLALVILSTIVYAVEKGHPGLVLVDEATREREAVRAERISGLDRR